MLHARRRRTSQISICECPDRATRAIDDFCKFVRTFGSAVDINMGIADDELSILCSEQKRYRVQAPPPSDVQHDSQARVSLHEFLDKEATDRRERMRLALQLSFAILQYYSTGWINTSWTWRDFSVSRIKGEDSEDSEKGNSGRSMAKETKRSEERTPRDGVKVKKPNSGMASGLILRASLHNMAVHSLRGCPMRLT